MDFFKIIVGGLILSTGIYLIAYCIMTPGTQTLHALLGGIFVGAHSAVDALWK